jgi:O-acetylhomoserine (thiol)-lyase
MTDTVQTNKVEASKPLPARYSRPLRPPIAATVAYAFDSFQHCADTYGHKVRSHAYSRLSNPTVEALEEAMAERTGALQCVGFSSGMAAVSAIYMGLCRPGKNIVSSSRLYGGTLALQKSIAEFGVEIRYANFDDADDVESKIDGNTMMLFSEPIANPAMDWYDYASIKNLSQKHGVLCVLDNTNTTALFDSMKWCDIDITSATKYVGGHGAGLGGLVLSGKFDLKGARYKHLDKPSGDFGGNSPVATGEYAFPNIMRGSQLRNFGACMSPFNAYLFTLGLDTLDLRMRDISHRTLEIAKLCAKHRAVDLVLHAELGPKATGIEKYFPIGTGGLFSFKLKGNLDNVRKFFDALSMIPVATNIGDSKTIVQHVESTSHSQLSRDQLAAAGIPTGLLRVSMGLESLDKLTKEFTTALDASI